MLFRSAANKSGVSTKLGVIFGAQVVDEAYQGEIHISVINTSTQLIKLFENQKMIQFVETPIYTSKVIISDNLDNLDNVTRDFHGSISDRGDGAFGSSDQKKK